MRQPPCRHRSWQRQHLVLVQPSLSLWFVPCSTFCFVLTFRLSSLRFLDPFDPFCLGPLSSVLSFVTLSTPSRIITYPRIANRCRVGSSLVLLLSVSDSHSDAPRLLVFYRSDSSRIPRQSERCTVIRYSSRLPGPQRPIGRSHVNITEEW